MSRIMLIDASHVEQTRVVVTDKSRVVEFDIEALNKKQTIGNIYLAKVTRVEPSLQAAFIEYGEGRQGFLPFSEIHPDYYQIPVEDRKRLLEEEEERYRAENEARESQYSSEGSSRGSDEEDSIAFVEEEELAKQALLQETLDDRDGLHHVDDALVESVAERATDKKIPDEESFDEEIDDLAESAPLLSDESDDNSDVIEATPPRKTRNMSSSDKPRSYVPYQKRYKIQEVIKKRQILLVQVVKGERGNKGASLTTYLSLAGRYCVLMPNTAHGGGISRKISNAKERQYLKEVVGELEIIKGMGLIVRTAGASRTKIEIKRDYEYLLKMWNIIRDVTMNSVAPSLIYEEGNLIKRTIRDTYSREISKIFVQGRAAYEQARDFMKLLMPSQSRILYHYNEAMPLFSKHQVEKQLEELTDNVVQLRSGGYLVINQTEALVAIDVNSGKSTNEFSVEDTALKTNLEASEEIARQLRMRDLAGLVVIDFIDMEDYRNIRSVERRMKEVIKEDRARIQMARISTFGLMEMTRQRLRPTMQDNLSNHCPHCKGTGHIVSHETGAIRVLRRIFEQVVLHKPSSLNAKIDISLANFILNKKRDMILDFERKHDVAIFIEGVYGMPMSDCDISTIARSNSDYNIHAKAGVVLDDALDDSHKPEYNESVDDEEQDSQKRPRRGKKRQERSHRQEVTPSVIQSDTQESGEEENVFFLNKRNKKPHNRREKNGRFNKRLSRYARYTPEPELFTTEGGTEVFIENPVSVLQVSETPNYENNNDSVQKDFVEHSQVISQEKADNEPIIEPITEESVVTKKPNKRGEKRGAKVASKPKESQDELLDNEPVQVNELEEVATLEDTQSQAQDEILELPEVKEVEYVEETPKPARKGWWKDRFRL